jgi:hypothetical protein
MQMPISTRLTRNKKWMSIATIAVVVLLTGAVLFFHKHTAAKAAANTNEISKYCVGQNFTAGSSGFCVTDIQILANYMEHSGLSECPFNDSSVMTVTGTYDQTTADHIKSIQKWSECYAAQEGFKSNVQQTGSVDQPTWGELCTFGYTDPKQRSASDATTAIAAGNNAGCAVLHKQSIL